MTTINPPPVRIPAKIQGDPELAPFFRQLVNSLYQFWHTSTDAGTGITPVTSGGTGLAALTDGGLLLGSGTDPVTVMDPLADGAIVVGDGATDPVPLVLLTSSTGTLLHERGGLEADISAIVDGDIIIGTSAGALGLESGATARASLGLAIGVDVQAYSVNLDEAGTFFGLTDITGAEAETLTDGSSADALHTHPAYQPASANLDEAVTFFGATDIAGSEAETLTDGSDAGALHVHDETLIWLGV